MKTYQDPVCVYKKIICRKIHCLLFEIYGPEILDMFVYKYTETTEYVRK